MKKLIVLVIGLLLVGCGEMLHGPKDTMTYQRQMSMADLSRATDILADHGHPDMIAIGGLALTKKMNYVFYYQWDIYCTKQGALGLYKARITMYRPQYQEGNPQIDSVTTQ